MFLSVKPRPPVINTFFTQSGKLGDTSAGFTQSLFFGDNFIDLTGVFLVNVDLRTPFTVNRQYILVTSGNSYENVTGNWSGYFYSGTTGDYRADNSLTLNSFYPTGLVSGDFTHTSSSFSVQYVEITDVPSGSPFVFTGSGWVASGSMNQNITAIRNEEVNLLNLKSRNFLKFCDDTLSGSGILTTGINDPSAFSSGIQKLIVDANTYYLNCSTGAFEVELFSLRPASTGISGSSCCGIHTYDIYPSGGDTGNFVFIKYDGVNQTFTGYSGEATGYDAGLLFPNLISEFISDLSGRIDFYFTGGHISCPPSRISGLSTGVTGIFAQINIQDGDFFGGNTLACFPTGEVGISGYNIFTEVHCGSGCIETGQFSQDNCVLYNKNTLSFITPRGTKPGNYDLRVENEFGKSTANGVIKLLAPPKAVQLKGAESCEFGQLPNSFLLGEWVKDYALTDEAGNKYFSSPAGNVYLDNFTIPTGDYSVMDQFDPPTGEDSPAIGFGELGCGYAYYGRAWKGILGVHFRRPNTQEVEEFEQSWCGEDVEGGAPYIPREDLMVPMLLVHPNVYFSDVYEFWKIGSSYPTQFINDRQIYPTTNFIYPHGGLAHGGFASAHLFFADVCNIKDAVLEGSNIIEYVPKERVYDCRNLIEETVILNPDIPGNGFAVGWGTITGAMAGATGTNYLAVQFSQVSGDSLRCNLNITGESYYRSSTMIKSAFVYRDRFQSFEAGPNYPYLNGYTPLAANLGQPSPVQFYPIKDSTRIIGISHQAAFASVNQNQNVSVRYGTDYLSFHIGCE